MAATIRCTSARNSKNRRQITPPFFLSSTQKSKTDQTGLGAHQRGTAWGEMGFARTKRADGTAIHEGFVSTLWGDRCPLRADPRAVSPACPTSEGSADRSEDPVGRPAHGAGHEQRTGPHGVVARFRFFEKFRGLNGTGTGRAAGGCGRGSNLAKFTGSSIRP